MVDQIDALRLLWLNNKIDDNEYYSRLAQLEGTEVYNPSEEKKQGDSDKQEQSNISKFMQAIPEHIRVILAVTGVGFAIYKISQK